MPCIAEVAERNGLMLLEDCAQAHGAISEKYVGTYGHAGVFSFYPTKNLGALGDAGAVLTKDRDLADIIRRMRSYGGGHLCGRLDHRIQGVNSRLDEMQAAVLTAKLPSLWLQNKRRRKRAEKYRELLSDGFVVLPKDDPGHVYHQFVIRVEDRDRVRGELRKRGIDCHVHYPVPPHLEGAFAGLNIKPQPVAEQLASDILSLPIGYDCDQERVAGALMEVCGTVHA